MVIPNVFRVLRASLLAVICLQTLTGCPGPGDRLHPDEEGHIIIKDGSVCFPVNGGDGYVLKYISINPRGINPKDEKIVFSPQLRISNELLCIPPSFYQFNKDGQYFIQASFASLRHADRPRRIVSALEVSKGTVHNIRPNDMEILRPYDEMIKN
ncbi:putative T6SS immunity periplasmic lipoprotein [Enterobacter sp. ECC-019]|uniref:putative T6SS immunity periplasmic lipoprotein n=1 Tax=Enterobacter sp. ECC-019 TaxID=3116478 RepID=UPI00375500FF